MKSLLDFLRKNPEFLLDKTKLRNALHDYYQEDIQSSNLLMLAYNHLDMLSQLQKDHPHIDLEKKTWTRSLAYAYSIPEKTASKTINQWISVFNDELKQRLRALVEEKYNERKQTADTFHQAWVFIEDEKYSEAEDLLKRIEQCPENRLEYTELLAEIAKHIKTQNTKTQEEAIKLFGEGHFHSYRDGIKTITAILDAYPDFRQAQIWLKNNPRETQVTKPFLSMNIGEPRCTLSWIDDDPYTMYTVCRAIGHYPQDPNDGICVCSEITNKQITDDLPKDQPGVIWQYSIFAVRILDKQWVKTDCPVYAVWTPDPTDITADIDKDNKGHPVVKLSWRPNLENSLGVHILRYDNDNNNFDFSSELLNVDSTKVGQQDAQIAGIYLDSNVFSGITYRYHIRQVWETGRSQHKSAGVWLERKIP